MQNLFCDNSSDFDFLVITALFVFLAGFDINYCKNFCMGFASDSFAT